jgi:hypothetical protein
MEINVVGPAAAFATFFGIWIGHVTVRKIEYELVNLWVPTFIVLSISVVLEVFSFLTSRLSLSVASGILAMTLCCVRTNYFISKNESGRDAHPQIQITRVTQGSLQNIPQPRPWSGSTATRAGWLIPRQSSRP